MKREKSGLSCCFLQVITITKIMNNNACQVSFYSTKCPWVAENWEVFVVEEGLAGGECVGRTHREDHGVKR